MFNINTDKLIDDLLSPRLRTTTVLQVLKSILQPIKSLVSWLNSFRTSTTLKLSYNGQVCSLERLLNDNFDPVNRDIYITDASSINMLVAYPQADIDRRIIISSANNFANYPVLAYQNTIVGENLHRFVINIPDYNEIRDRENELKATVQRYKLAGKCFFLRYY